jgi:hypothetical protein
MDGVGTPARMSDRPPVDPFPYPRQLVVGVIPDEGGGQRVSESLLQAGFAPDHVVVLHGEEDARRLDVEGDEHGPPGKLIRVLQAALSFDLDHVRRHAAHLRSGEYVVAAAVGEDEGARHRAVEALRAAGAGFINYYGDNYIQSYEPTPHRPAKHAHG